MSERTIRGKVDDPELVPGLNLTACEDDAFETMPPSDREGPS